MDLFFKKQVYKIKIFNKFRFYVIAFKLKIRKKFSVFEINSKLKVLKVDYLALSKFLVVFILPHKYDVSAASYERRADSIAPVSTIDPPIFYLNMIY